MNDYTTVNILDMLDAIGEDELINILSDFSCPKNPEIENFVKNDAINFAKRKLSVTYLVINDSTGELVSIYTLTHKALEISNKGLSETARRKLSRFSALDEESDCYTVSAFLIAQFGKNYAVQKCSCLSGNRLMEKAFDTLMQVQRSVGGGIVYLECENEPHLLSFYQNESNRFRQFGKRYSKKDEIEYIQLLRFF